MALRGKRSEISIVTWTLIELIVVITSMLLIINYVNWRFADDKVLIEFLVKDLSLTASALTYVNTGSYLNYYEPILINPKSEVYEIKTQDGIVYLTKNNVFTYEWPYTTKSSFHNTENSLRFKSYISTANILITNSNGEILYKNS